LQRLVPRTPHPITAISPFKTIPADDKARQEGNRLRRKLERCRSNTMMPMDDVENKANPQNIKSVKTRYEVTTSYQVPGTIPGAK
jgi:hypothetical protein